MSFYSSFDSGTKIKLEIFERYFKEWLPVFLSTKNARHWKKIYIYDFFAGQGKDEGDNLGSSLQILKVLKENHQRIDQSKVQEIHVLFNEKNKNIFNVLKSNCEEERKLLHPKIQLKIYNKEFKILFDSLYKEMEKTTEYPRLMFLDQFGIKEIALEVFNRLVQLKRNDFIFFISSFFVKRFNELESFQKYIRIEKEEIKESKPHHAHRVIFKYYKSRIKTNYKIAPFSIKKDSNVYGLIFGSNHSLGLEKFLKVTWKMNPNTGDANFNIDEEKIIGGQLSFEFCKEDNTIKKLALFQKKVEELIFEKKELSLYKLYLFTLEYGCLPKHLNEKLKELIKTEKIKEIKLITEKIHKLKGKAIKIQLK